MARLILGGPISAMRGRGLPAACDALVVNTCVGTSVCGWMCGALEDVIRSVDEPEVLGTGSETAVDAVGLTSVVSMGIFSVAEETNRVV
jgi:hypothetical protein